jgi:hypothetical protein
MGEYESSVDTTNQGELQVLTLPFLLPPLAGVQLNLLDPDQKKAFRRGMPFTNSSFALLSPGVFLLLKSIYCRGPFV